MSPERGIGSGRRFGLWAASLAAALVAQVVMMFPTDDSTPWQVLFTIVTIAFLAASPWFAHALPIAGASATAVAAFALIDTDFPALPLVVSGMLTLCAFDLMALVRMWRSVGRLDLDAERVHLVATAQRCGLGGIVAVGIMVVGVIELPSSGVAAAIGVAAAALVIVLTASRSA